MKKYNYIIAGTEKKSNGDTKVLVYIIEYNKK